MRFIFRIIFSFSCLLCLYGCKTMEPKHESGSETSSIGAHYYKYFAIFKWNAHDRYLFAVTKNIAQDPASCWYQVNSSDFTQAVSVPEQDAKFIKTKDLLDFSQTFDFGFKFLQYSAGDQVRIKETVRSLIAQESLQSNKGPIDTNKTLSADEVYLNKITDLIEAASKSEIPVNEKCPDVGSLQFKDF
jgi:hypothetical protein